MLQKLFGSRPEPPKRAKADEIKKFAKRHNKLVESGKIKLPKKAKK